jgi:hypothetical protein
MPLSLEIHEMMQAIAKARSELTAAGMEMRQTFELARTAYAEAEKARAEAATAYADAVKVMSEAQAYHDAALNSAATIIREARAAAEGVRQAYADAVKVLSDAQAYHDTALTGATTIIREAKDAAADIKQAAREAAGQRTSYRTGNLASRLLHSQNRTGGTIFIVDGTSGTAGRAEWLRWLDAVVAGANATDLTLASHPDEGWLGWLPTENNPVLRPMAADTFRYGPALPSVYEGPGEICRYEIKFPFSYGILSDWREVTRYRIQDPSRDLAEPQPQPGRSN